MITQQQQWFLNSQDSNDNYLYIRNMSNKKIHVKLQPIPTGPNQSKKKSKKMQVIEGNETLNRGELDILNFRNEETLEVYDKRRNIYKETDLQLMKDVRSIVAVKNKSLFEMINKEQLTSHQYDELHYRAKIHGKANTINENSKLDFKYIPEYDRCNCGCMRGKGKPIPLLIDEDKLRELGPGILLQFLFQRASASVLAVATLVYGVFALVTNFIGNSSSIGEACQQKLYCKFTHYISDENKAQIPELFIVQNWLGVVFCFFWIFSIKVIKYFGEHRNRIIDEKLRSSADYAIKIQNLPRESYEEKEVIWHIEDLWKQRMKAEREILEREKEIRGLHDIESSNHKLQEKLKLEIKSIQIIYNMEFSRKMNKQIFQLAKNMQQFFVDEEGTNKGNGEKHYIVDQIGYSNAKQKLKDTFILQKDLRKRFLNDPEFRRRLSTTCALIEFHKPRNVRYLIKHFGNEKIGTAKQIKMRILNFFNPDIRSILFKGNMLRIEKAPEPSDILWENCQKPESLRRKVGILCAQVIILLISYGLIFGLQILKLYVRKNPQKFQVGIVTTVINYATSFSLQIINWLFWKIMSKLLDLQYNHTQTQKIISLMNIVFIMSSINVIGLPILTNFTINAMYSTPVIYGDEGVNSLAFDYHVSLVLGTLLKIVNTVSILKFIIVNTRWLRYKMIWNFYRKSGAGIATKLQKGDEQVNLFYEGEYYDVAQNYIFTITNMLHAVFFCKLQPLILPIMTINILIFYLVNKIRLLRFCKMPGMVDYLVFDNAVWMLGFIPLYFGAGSIALSYFQNQESQDYPFSMLISIPSFLCMGLGLLCVLNPGGILNSIIHCFFNNAHCLDIQEVMGAYDGGDVEDASDEESVSEDSSVLQINAEESRKEHDFQKNFRSSTRFESYYSGRFQKVLKGEQIKSSSEELKLFCESFFPEREKGQRTLREEKIKKELLANEKYQQQKAKTIQIEDSVQDENEKI